MADTTWSQRFAAFQAFLEPSPEGFDVFYSLVSVLGFTVSHGMENLNRPNRTYTDQLLEAGPSTYFGYFVGLILAGLPFTNLLASLPFLSHLLCFTDILNFSQKSALQICVYVIHAGKVFGWKVTGLLMGLGFILSPLLTTIATLLGYSWIFYGFVFVISILQVIFTLLSGWNYGIFNNFSEQALDGIAAVVQKLPGVLWIFEKLSDWYGVEFELQSALHRKSFNLKMAQYRMFFVDPDDARRFPLRLLREISRTIAPGNKLMNCECSFRNIALNIRGMRMRAEKSPEYGVMKLLRTSTRDSPAITEKTMRYQTEEENEGIRICLDAGFAQFRDGVLVPSTNNWTTDKTKHYLRDLGSPNQVNQPPRKFLVSFMDRDMIDAIVDFKGQIRRPRNTTSYISLSLPDAHGTGAPV